MAFCSNLCYWFIWLILHKLIPAGQIGLKQHIGLLGRCSQQVGEQQWHLEALPGTHLQNWRGLILSSTAPVGQLVKLTVETGETCTCGGDRQDKGTEKAEVIGSIQTDQMLLPNQPSRKCHKWLTDFFGVCLYLVPLIITFQTRIPVIIQTPLCWKTLKQKL